MKKRVYMDGILVDWGDTLFALTPNTKSRPTTSTKQRLGASAISRNSTSNSGRAAAIRSKLSAVARRSPEVMVKISGSGKAMTAIRAHQTYITRKGELPMEDQDGQIIRGRDDLALLADEWQFGNAPIPAEDTVSSKREAFNIVLSMPAGTPPLAVQRAARDFAAREFTGHRYGMVLHTFDTDPKKDPSLHPHVHLIVKARSIAGRRLDPRKHDLQRWREGFAEALRENGVDASATKREPRFNRYRGDGQAVHHMRRREVKLNHIGRSNADPIRIARARETDTKISYSYMQIIKALKESDDMTDRSLSDRLFERVKSMRIHDKPRTPERQPILERKKTR